LGGVLPFMFRHGWTGRPFFLTTRGSTSSFPAFTTKISITNFGISPSSAPFFLQPHRNPPTQHHSTTSRTPYSSSSRPARPALLPSRPATGRSSSVPQTASSSSHTHSNNLHSSTGRPGRDRNGPGSGGRRAEGTGAGGKKEGVDGGQHVKTLKEWVGTRKRGKGLIDLSVSQV